MDGQCVIAEELHNSTLMAKVHVHRERNGTALVSVNSITDTEVDALKAALTNVIVFVLMMLL